MKKLLLILLTIPSLALAQYPQQIYVQPVQPLYPGYNAPIAVVPVQPQPLNNLDRQVILQYQLEATENLQLRNDALRQHITQDSSGFGGLDPSTGQDKGKFEIIGY